MIRCYHVILIWAITESCNHHIDRRESLIHTWHNGTAFNKKGWFQGTTSCPCLWNVIRVWISIQMSFFGNVRETLWQVETSVLLQLAKQWQTGVGMVNYQLPPRQTFPTKLQNLREQGLGQDSCPMLAIRAVRKSSVHSWLRQHNCITDSVMIRSRLAGRP